MRVAFLSFDFAEYCIRLAGALAQDAEVMLLLPGLQAEPHLSKLDRRVQFRPFHKPRLRQPIQQVRMAYTLMRHVRRFHPDVLHIQQGHMWFNWVLPLLRRYPLVLTIHDPRHHLGDMEAKKHLQGVIDFGYRRAHEIIVHGEQQKRVVTSECRITAGCVHVVPHVMLGEEEPGGWTSEEEHTILFFGRIWEYKGLEYLIKAEPLITAAVPDAKIIIAGEGEEFSRYRQMLTHPERFTVYNEYVPDDRRAKLFRQASIVVLPYIDASQSGVVPLAYTAGKPVVATTVGALPEIVEHGRTGYLVPPRDERALAEAIVHLLRYPELRRRMGANGKLKIETECSPAVIASRTLEVYNRVARGYAPGRRDERDGQSAQFGSALKLHRYLVSNSWSGHALVGPDPGVRFNYRIGRFIKGYLHAVPWNDSLYYLQGQGYWILGNWRLLSITGEESCREVATRCSEYMLTQQRGDGAWEYPNREWKGRVATAEGVWGALGLLETYRHTGAEKFLTGALRWHRYMTEEIGFQRDGAEVAVNYFAGQAGSRIPNNSAMALRFLAELADVTGEAGYLEPCAGMVAFLSRVQKVTGEFPYAVEGAAESGARPHFQCAQYNAFMCLDLMRYHELTDDDAILPLMQGTLSFLSRSLAPYGQAYYECGNSYRAVTYHAAVLAAAFAEAGRLDISGYAEPARRAYSYVLRQQERDGSFPHSRGDYRVLSDKRAYPRYLAMILYHLLLGEVRGAEDDTREEAAHYVR